MNAREQRRLRAAGAIACALAVGCSGVPPCPVETVSIGNACADRAQRRDGASQEDAPEASGAPSAARGGGSAVAGTPAPAGAPGVAGSTSSTAGTGATATAGTGALGGMTAGTGASTAASGSTAMAGTPAMAMAMAGSGAGGGALQDCAADSGGAACGTFTPLRGAKIQLGPLGAQMDANVGQGFENSVSDRDRSPDFCADFASVFDQEEVAKMLLDTQDFDFALYSVFHPANWESGKTYPVLLWGNGTCTTPEGYGALLRYIASYGFVVVAANSRHVNDLALVPKPMLHALDFAVAANQDPISPYYQKLDLDHVGVMGHSQGGAATSWAVQDPRVTAVILFNGGLSASKPFMTISGDRDVLGSGASTAADLRSPVQAAPKAAFIFYHMVPMQGSYDGHLTLILQPERVVAAATQWWKAVWGLDPAAKDWFVGASCKLCGMDAQFEFGQKGLE